MGEPERTAPRTSIGPRLRAILDLGRVTWPGGKPRGAKTPLRVHGRTVAEALVEDRR